MEFFKILDNLKEQYKNDMVVRKNDTILLHPDKVPRCKHMLFNPLTDEIIKEYLVDVCVQKFPDEYIRFLKYSNGANLATSKVWHTVKSKKIATAHSSFIIFGLPRTPPFSRKPDMEEPFDLRIEDLRRHDDVPEHWIKCGTYSKEPNFAIPYDIFIDTHTEKVYSCITEKSEIVDSWETLDECFCSIYNALLDSKEEYEYVKENEKYGKMI